MGYDPFCGRLTDGQLYQRAPLPVEELEDDLRMLPGVGKLMAARDAYQGIQRLSKSVDAMRGYEPPMSIQNLEGARLGVLRHAADTNPPAMLCATS